MLETSESGEKRLEDLKIMQDCEQNNDAYNGDTTMKKVSQDVIPEETDDNKDDNNHQEGCHEPDVGSELGHINIHDPPPQAKIRFPLYTACQA